MTTDTYLCARASGDVTYLRWLRKRLTSVYKESSQVDFVWTLDNFAGYFERRRTVPWWLDWILRRYTL